MKISHYSLIIVHEYSTDPLSELTIVTDILTIIITILRPILDTLQKVKFLAGS